MAAGLACLIQAGVAGAAAAPAPPAGGARGGFENVTAALGLDYAVPPGRGGEPREIGARIMEAGGLALADIDGDGRLELYIAHGNREPGRLFGHDGHRFVRLAGDRGIRPAGIESAGYFVDLDQDGHRDFVSVASDGLQTFRNDGSGRFTAARGILGVAHGRNTHSMAAADYDGDGDLDLFFAHWLSLWNPLEPLSHYLWRNDGRGRYEDVSRLVPVRSGYLPRSGFERELSFTPTFADIDADGDPDLLLASDFGTSQVLRNDAGRTFTDISGDALTDENGMGAAVVDVDRDGDLDWFVTSIHKSERRSGREPTGNRLYLNIGGAEPFVDVSDLAQVREGGWGWGACAADFDNDGHADLFHTNGWFDTAPGYGLGGGAEFTEFVDDPSRLFMSNGDGTFSERSSQLGIDHRGQGRGVVCADYDGDGRVDIFIANHGAAPAVFANRIENAGHWLAIDLAGRHANPAGVGARVVVHTASGTQTQEVRLGTGYLSQGPATLHFGLGGDRTVSAVEVQWPGPGRAVSRLANVEADRRLVIRQPEPEGVLLRVVRGTGGGLHAGGEAVPIEADAPRGHYRFSHWTSEGGGAFADARALRTTFTMPPGAATVFAHYLPGPPLSDPDVSAARRWVEVMLEAIRDDFARPTVHARNLFHLSAAMYDAWAVHSQASRPWRFGDAPTACTPPAPVPGADVRGAREEALSHAAWRLIRHRFRRSPGFARTGRNTDSLMSALGHDPAHEGAAAAVGRCIGELYIARGLADGSNEAEDYASTAYRPVNRFLDPWLAGAPDLDDADRWQPLAFPRFIDQAGNMTAGIPEFVTPEWGRVTPFALGADALSVHRRDGAAWRVHHDPGPPPLLAGPGAALFAGPEAALFAGPGAELYRWGFALVARWSGDLSPADGVVMDIAPSGIGNLGALPRRFEDHPAFYEGDVLGPGHRLNPATGEPYAPQLVPRGDYLRVLAEFWADGPDSETPPGHWFVILNAAGDHERFVRRLGGTGPVLDALEWDVKAYFALGGAMHDAAIAAWSIKGWYDSIRPVSALRWMAARGQSSDPALPSWSPGGLPLVEGAIELVGPGDTLAGEEGEHIGKVKVRAWRGPELIADPGTDVAGVGWILAERWWPYQRSTFVTPPFAGYVSGHSTFSRAAGEVLTALTGDAFFPGGMSGFPVRANEFLVFERGPSVDMTLQWATYRDAADQCSLSRIWGGIHPPADDIPGRLIGERIGIEAFRFAVSHF